MYPDRSTSRGERSSRKEESEIKGRWPYAQETQQKRQISASQGHSTLGGQGRNRTARECVCWSGEGACACACEEVSDERSAAIHEGRNKVVVDRGSARAFVQKSD